MLEGVFGNSTAERVLLYVEVNQSGYAQEIADALHLRLSGVQRQLARLEAGGVLVSRLIGKTRVFQFTPRFAFTDGLREILQKAFTFLPEGKRRQYQIRRRPRTAGKPLHRCAPRKQ